MDFFFLSPRNTTILLFQAQRPMQSGRLMKQIRKYVGVFHRAKAFDCITSDSLPKALSRFGSPPKILSMIGAIYHESQFYIQDYMGTSSLFHHNAGIACPLSLFLFIIVQTEMLHVIRL